MTPQPGQEPDPPAPGTADAGPPPPADAGPPPPADAGPRPPADAGPRPPTDPDPRPDVPDAPPPGTPAGAPSAEHPTAEEAAADTAASTTAAGDATAADPAAGEAAEADPEGSSRRVLVIGALVVTAAAVALVAIGRGVDAPALGILGSTVVVVVLGTAALAALSRTVPAGHGVAIAGICLGAVGTVSAATAALVLGTDSRTTPPRAAAAADVAMPPVAERRAPTVGDRDVYIDDVPIGQCFVTAAAGRISTVDIVACSAAHDRELFGRLTLRPGRYPGDKAVDREADRGCRPLFARYVGRDVEASVLNYTWTAPGQAAWSAAARQVNCLIADPRGRKLTGTARASDR